MIKLFRKRKSAPETMNLWLNRVRYLVIWLLIGGVAWLYGERMLYVALAVFTVLPFITLIIAFIGLRTLKINYSLPHTVPKKEYCEITVSITNAIRIPFGRILCVFYSDDFAVSIQDTLVTDVGSLKPIDRTVEFNISYRGEYTMGIESLQTMDLTGLFRLNRKFNMDAKVIALPGIADMSNYPIANNLLTQAQSRHDIRDEDYATISDIRPYLPTDSIKRVHWKLTAKRNEWLVKNFQSNALHQITLIIDSKRIGREYTEQIVMEDRMIEVSLGLARHCLRRGMPVDYMAGEGHKTISRTPADFDAVYNTASVINFEESPALSPGAILAQCLNDAAGYVNAIILTARLDAPLYERIANAQNNGHNIAVMYFSPRSPRRETENIFRLLEEGGSHAYRIPFEEYGTEVA
ncbi:MAG: DUF58 domain-containing protein [Defluviitaleaceae bacterium]|nr:DUF58 domain-containing protein [Defluviitaleaceae bacterium]